MATDFQSLIAQLAIVAKPPAPAPIPQSAVMAEAIQPTGWAARNVRVCVECGERLAMDAVGVAYCRACGREDESTVQDDTLQNALLGHSHNIGRNSYMSFKVTGNNASRYQKQMLYICSNTETHKLNTVRREFESFMYEGHGIPKSVYNSTVDMISKIVQAGYIFRGNTKLGIWGACLASTCTENGISKTSREIADIFHVDDRFIAAGDRRLQELAEEYVVDMPKPTQQPDYIAQALAALEIPSQYMAFVRDFIARTKEKCIHNVSDARMSTSIAGAIYILTRRVKALRHITREMISTETKAAKPTIVRHVAAIYLNYRLVKRVFRAHRIPMPCGWKHAPGPASASAASQ